MLKQDSPTKTATSSDTAMSSNNKNHSDDEVGYGKPPKKFQFKKGQSGNPLGRPKKKQAMPDVLNGLMAETMTLNGKTVTMLEAFLISLRNDAIKGKASARNLFLPLIQNLKMEPEGFDETMGDKLAVAEILYRLAKEKEAEQQP